MAKRTPKKSQTKGSQPADAVHMLKADHKHLRKLIEQFYAAPDDDKGTIAGRLFIGLHIHSTLEEELFYPAVQAKLEALGKLGDGLDINENIEVEKAEDAEANLDEIDGAELAVVDDKDTASEVISAAYDSHQTIQDLIQQL